MTFEVLIWIQRNLNYFPKVDEAAANKTEPSIDSHRRLAVVLFIAKIKSHKDDVIGEKNVGLCLKMSIFILVPREVKDGEDWVFLPEASVI